MSTVFSIVTLSILFVGIVVLIATDKVNRAVLALFGAVVTYFLIIFVEKGSLLDIIGWIIGNADENYGNLRTIVLIISMMIIVEISNEGGLFQFIAFKLIQMTKGKPVPLLLMFDVLTVVISAILNNILTVLVLIPLTITVCRILSINATPYILTEAILVNIGGTMFTISSIPNIMISSYAMISFVDFFVNVGLVSIGIFGATLLFFYFIYRNKLQNPIHGVDILLEFNVWNFVSNRGLMLKSAIIFLITIFLFTIIPTDQLSPDMIALIMSIILLFICKLDPKQIIKKIDFELILYLVGIYIIAGGMEYVGIIGFFGDLFSKASQGDAFLTLMITIWGSAYLSANIDNIPITRVLLPVTKYLTQGLSESEIRLAYYGLAIGANWGDNVTPLGDNVLVMNAAEQNKSPIKIKDFFLLGFVTTNFQLYLITVYYTLQYQPIQGMILLSIGVSILLLYVLITKFKIFDKFKKLLTKLKDQFLIKSSR